MICCLSGNVNVGSGPSGPLDNGQQIEYPRDLKFNESIIYYL